MERRALLAIALSVGILLAWQMFLAPPPSPPPPPAAIAPAPAPPAGDRPAVAPGAPAPGSIAGLPRDATSTGGAAATVMTPLYRADFGADGAVRSWELRYRGTKPVALGGATAPLTVGVRRPDQPIELVPLRPEATRLELTAASPTGVLAFSGRTADGLAVRRVLTFRADSYAVGVELTVEGRASAGPGREVFLFWTSPVQHPDRTQTPPWITFGEGSAHEQVLGRILVGLPTQPLEVHAAPPKDAAPSGTELKDPQMVAATQVSADSGFVALENDYFIAALVAPAGAQLWRSRERDLAGVALVAAGAGRDPATAWQARSRLYVGPKEWSRLQAFGVGLERAQSQNYGDFVWVWPPMWWFCLPLLWLMNFFGTQVPGQNYGVAIILLTLMVKLAFYPLTQKSMSSMKKMQALQPQVNALRSKYRSDTQRLQREQMELFRKHNVNPMGGCLPMVVQVPIFYALYLTLQYSVELQGAHFLLWITDLSKKDPYYVLPILMGVSMLVQQKMTPTVGDPRQARIMLIMPVIFTFMFLEFPTGLVLYWLVNNVLSIGQQYLIDRAAHRAAALEGSAAKPDREARKA